MLKVSIVFTLGIFLYLQGCLCKSSEEILSDWQSKIQSYDAFFGEDDSGVLDSTGYPHGLYMVK